MECIEIRKGNDGLWHAEAYIFGVHVTVFYKGNQMPDMGRIKGDLWRAWEGAQK